MEWDCNCFVGNVGIPSYHFADNTKQDKIHKGYVRQIIRHLIESF